MRQSGDLVKAHRETGGAVREVGTQRHDLGLSTPSNSTDRESAPWALRPEREPWSESGVSGIFRAFSQICGRWFHSTDMAVPLGNAGLRAFPGT